MVHASVYIFEEKREGGEPNSSEIRSGSTEMAANQRLAAAALALSVALALAALATAAFDVATIPFDEGFKTLFGEGNLVKSSDGRKVSIFLNRYTGSGFISSAMYHHGLFSAMIKLPSEYTAGVVVAFYTSNGDVWEKTHDELDFEFLGNIKGMEWRIQTNVYGNHSVSRGREERYVLPFDPTKEAHRYSILWTADTILFYIDDIPIREVKRSEAMGGDYPSKPMSLYATIWDGSTWATANGKYPVKYKYEPFVSEFSELTLHGCRIDNNNIQQVPAAELCADTEAELEDADYSFMTYEKRQAMKKFRERYMTYTHCYDTQRYPTPFPECDIDPDDQKRFMANGEPNNVNMIYRRRRPKRRNKTPRPTNPGRQSDI